MFVWSCGEVMRSRSQAIELSCQCKGSLDSWRKSITWAFPCHISEMFLIILSQLFPILSLIQIHSFRRSISLYNIPSNIHFGQDQEHFRNKHNKLTKRHSPWKHHLNTGDTYRHHTRCSLLPHFSLRSSSYFWSSRERRSSCRYLSLLYPNTSKSGDTCTQTNGAAGICAVANTAGCKWSSKRRCSEQVTDWPFSHAGGARLTCT